MRSRGLYCFCSQAQAVAHKDKEKTPNCNSTGQDTFAATRTCRPVAVGGLTQLWRRFRAAPILPDFEV